MIERIRKSKPWTVLAGVIAFAGVYAVLVTIGVAPVLDGFIGETARSIVRDPTPWFIGALVLSNLVLGSAVVYLLRRPPKMASMPATPSPRPTSRHTHTSPTAAPRREPVHWLSNDSITTTLTNSVLEAAHKACLRFARANVAPDVAMRMNSITLMPAAEILFIAVSGTANKRAGIRWRPDEGALLGRVETGRELSLDDGATPWRADRGWRRLLDDTWAQERPMEGSATLFHGGQWYVQYERRLGPNHYEHKRYELRGDSVVSAPGR